MTFIDEEAGPELATDDNGTRRLDPAEAIPKASPALGAKNGPAKKRYLLQRKLKLQVPAKRQISSIAFPYVDLDTIVAMARAMHENGGLALTRDQLAGALRQSPSSGSFMLKMGAARQYGILEQTAGGKYQLTNLGFAIVSRDERKERAARAEAFLNVPLFRRTYDEFRGRQLPPRPLGLENAFVQFGVAPKQKDNARLIFEKAAKQAGFLSVDPDRLIEPITGAGVPVEGPVADVGSAPQPSVFYGGGPTQLDPLIQGLVDRLPEPGSVWESDKRARWLQTLAANFDMVYDSKDGGVIVVEIKKGTVFD